MYIFIYGIYIYICGSSSCENWKLIYLLNNLQLQYNQ
jgi:hypothetical protein